MLLSTLDISVSTLDLLLSTLDSRQLPRLVFVAPGVEQIMRFNQSLEFNSRCFSKFNRFAASFVESADYTIKIAP